MNIYYQFPFTVSVLGRPGGGYYVQRGVQPIWMKGKPADLSEYAMRYAVKVWHEDDEGIKVVKNYDAFNDLKPKSLDYDEQEFLLVKLGALELG